MGERKEEPISGKRCSVIQCIGVRALDISSSFSLFSLLFFHSIVIVSSFKVLFTDGPADDCSFFRVAIPSSVDESRNFTGPLTPLPLRVLYFTLFRFFPIFSLLLHSYILE